MTKASDNEFPSLLVKEGTTPATPAAGDQRLFVRSSDHVLCYVNSSGTVTPVSSGGLADQGVFTYLDGTVAAAPGTPATGKLRMYAKTGKVLAVKDDAGLETVLGQGIADQGNVATYLDFSDQGSDPASPAASHHRIYAKAGGFYDKDSSGTVVGAFGAGGAGGVTQAYLGYNTAGASTETIGANGLVYVKSVAPANACLITGVEAYLEAASTSNWVPPLGLLYDDNAGAPGKLLGYGGGVGALQFLANTARWFSCPLGIWVPAGTYWIGIELGQSGGAIFPKIHYDTGGSDRTQNNGGTAFADWTVASDTTTSNKYSIRANTIR